MRLGVLVSGRGSNLRRLVEAGFDIAAVATNRPSCPAAAFAQESGLAVRAFLQREYADAAARDEAMKEWLRKLGVELVVLAGWDRVLTEGFVKGFPDRILNVHPSLLPAFAGGMDAVEQALRHGVKVSGCTVHIVSAEVDAGRILLQAAVPVLEDDTVETLHARIQTEEHRILPEAIRLVVQRERAGASLG